MLTKLQLLHPVRLFAQGRERFLADSLFRNSVFIMLSMGAAAGFGFFFWIVCARFYSAETVGLLGAIISISVLIMSISLLGFNYSFIRYLAQEVRKQRLINTGIILTTVTAGVITFAYLLLIPLLTPALDMLRADLALGLLFLSLTIATTFNNLGDSIFIALRAAHYNFIKYSLFGVLRLALPIALVGFGLAGLLASQTIAMIIAAIAGGYFMVRHFKHQFKTKLDRETVRKVAAFSAFNYASSLVNIVPGLILPLVIIHALGAEQSAYFYMAMTIANLIYVVPSAISSSLFAEASYNEQLLGKLARSTAKMIFALLVPTCVVAVALGGLAFSIFGQGYAEFSTIPFFWLVLAALPIAANEVLGTILKLKHKMADFFAINFVGSASILIASYLLAAYGLAVVGICWFAGQALMSLLFAWRVWALRRAATK